MTNIVRLSGSAGIVLCAALLGCDSRGGETNKDLLSRYGDKIKQRRESLSKLATMLPPAGTFTANEKCPALDPPLMARTGDVGQISPGNCDWMMVERLGEPVRNDLNPRPFDRLLLQSALLDAIGLADPSSRNYCADSRENVAENAHTLQAASEVRYIIVLRPLEHDKPSVAKGEDADAPLRYTDGRVVLEGVICDLEGQRLVCGFRAVAEPSFSKTMVTVEKGKSAALRLESELESKLMDEARKQVFAGLALVTGK